MNGIRSGRSQPGRVVFTLTNIKMKDIELYLCMLRTAFGDSNQYDDLKLAVKGNCRLSLFLICIILFKYVCQNPSHKLPFARLSVDWYLSNSSVCNDFFALLTQHNKTYGKIHEISFI